MTSSKVALLARRNSRNLRQDIFENPCGWSKIRWSTDLDLLDLLVDGGGGGGAVDRGAVLAVDLDEGVAVVL